MRLAASLLLLALATAGAASAQVSDAPRPKRRVVPAVAAPVVAPPVRATPVPAVSGRMTLGGLAGLPPIDDRGASCRSGCARSRYTCEVQEEVCVQGWNACLKSCSDAQVPPLTALLPR